MRVRNATWPQWTHDTALTLRQAAGGSFDLVCRGGGAGNVSQWTQNGTLSTSINSGVQIV
ncbi:uncharacterized protein ACA1_256470 [Acanthamoeba castellanii str. Neff]|uniref:Uncharacterized protein n=1 Tax=Acanthamoeba castellanii (strain ATCC 30010 / Neff) TaxID=1257118 RepID=L8GFK6_ACACF|nr:uncharacterized protein ACA1_256470 [Acanthamoeba castellanii str. Neff]ELR11508.1 hypothetical protein ACA1_256470 [Acanthamoeba castellanii str. Neff]